MTTDSITRRGFVAGGLATGFALAVQPVSAETTHTDEKGLTAGAVTFKGPDGFTVPAYRAFPEKGGPFPTVLVVQEIFGVHEHIKDLCRRFAKAGYYAIAPELYARQGDVSKIEDFSKIISDVVSKVPDAQVMGDLDAAVAYAKGTGKADTGRLSITGFCWGGRVVWLYAAHNPKVDAGAAWYGRLTGGFTPDAKNPVDVGATLKVPVLGLYGGKDNGIPQADVEKMRAELAKGKSGSEIIVYPDAGHGFNADYRPSYAEKDAKDAWAKMLAWFDKHGAGPKKA
jgi:carboxymethylenebutenolidase